VQITLSAIRVLGLVTIATLSLSSLRAEAGGGRYGDANCDQRVNSVDSAVVLQASAGLITSPACAATADVNGDARINSLDSALILQYAAGLLDHLGPPLEGCEPSYPTLCIPPPPPDLDCVDMPFSDFPVFPPDPHALDTDHDGTGCESG